MNMAKLSQELLLNLVRRTIEEEPLGVYIRTNNTNSFKKQLYDAITSVDATPEQLGIMICIPSEDGLVFLTRRSVELEP